MSFYRSKRFVRDWYPGTGRRRWRNWRWQWASRIRDPRLLAAMTGREVLPPADGRPLCVTPYYASLMCGHGNERLQRAVLPEAEIFRVPSGGRIDPLGEARHEVIPGVIRIYPDKLLVLAAMECAVYCRFCTRGRILENKDSRTAAADPGALTSYLRGHPEIRDVLISGGDPLVLPDDRLLSLLRAVRSVSSVEVIRIGTRVPAVIPQRVTRTLARRLAGFQPLWMMLHFMHPAELTAEAARACGRLADAGLPLTSQTVLLRAVNDDIDILRRLFQGLVKLRVKPYYLHLCDDAAGTAHFRVAPETGMELIRKLHGFTSGFAVPQLCLDAPGGGGKVPLLPDYIVKREPEALVVRNYLGKHYRYPAPPPRLE